MELSNTVLLKYPKINVEQNIVDIMESLEAKPKIQLIIEEAIQADLTGFKRKLIRSCTLKQFSSQSKFESRSKQVYSLAGRIREVDSQSFQKNII